MKFSAIVSSLLLSGAAIAQEVQSKPFNLVISSSSKTLNGKKLGACHSGAAIESLCVAGKTGDEFYLNTTKGETAPIKGYSSSGALIWNLPVEPVDESEPMSFYIEPSTNVAQLMFQPSYDTQYVTFDKNSQLAIFSYLDDTKSPPTDETTTVLKNWYVCETIYSAYQYQTLNWVLGNGKAKPQNPSCVKVEVVRKYV